MDVNSVNQHGMTALHALCNREDAYDYTLDSNDVCEFTNMIYRCVCLLLERGALINVYDNNRHTPLYYAVKSGLYKVTEELLKHGADANARTNLGDTPMCVACKDTSYKYLRQSKRLADDSVEMLQLLFTHGAEINVKGTGCIPLLEACRWKRPPYVQFLLEHGAEVDATPYNHETALMTACATGCFCTVVLLLEYGADVNAISSGRTSLMYSCQGFVIRAWHSPDLSCIKALLRHGADIDCRDSDGRTALLSLVMALAEEGPASAHEAQAATVSLLLEHGADLTVANNEGSTVRDVAGVSEEIRLVLEKAQHRNEHVLK